MSDKTLNQIRIILAGLLDLDVSEINKDTCSENTEKWDSLVHMNLIIALEGEFEIRFKDDMLERFSSVQIIDNHIKKLISDQFDDH